MRAIFKVCVMSVLALGLWGAPSTGRAQSFDFYVLALSWSPGFCAVEGQDKARDLFPSEGLARYQWRKHGGCSDLAPAAWFNDVRRARAAINVPPSWVSVRSDRQMEPEDILRQFREANLRLRPGMAAISCPRMIFQEIRICMSADLRDFVSCPQVVQQSCRARSISVKAP